jgi:hypothetical protein
MEAACTCETSVDNYFTRQYIPEDKSEQTYYRLCYRKHLNCMNAPIQNDNEFLCSIKVRYLTVLAIIKFRELFSMKLIMHEEFLSI